MISDTDIDFIESELKKTEAPGSKISWPPTIGNTHWYNAITRLETFRSSPTPPTPPPPTPPPVPPTNFNKTFSGGNLDAFLAGCRPGDKVQVTANGKLSAPITNGGSSSSPIYVDWGGHVIDGRLDMRGGAKYWHWYNFGARDLAPNSPGQSWVIGGSYNIFDYFETLNGHTKIGWEFIWDGTYGQAVGNTLSRGRIHQIGRMPAGSTNNDHGIYDVAHAQHYVDLLIYDCSDRGMQLRGAQGAHAEFFTITGCGEGIIFGDIGADKCLVENFIATDNIVKSRYLVEEYDPGNQDSQNTVRNFISFNKDGRQTIGGLHSVTLSAMQHIDPQLDSKMMPQNPQAKGMGCRVQPPVIF